MKRLAVLSSLISPSTSLVTLYRVFELKSPTKAIKSVTKSEANKKNGAMKRVFTFRFPHSFSSDCSRLLFASLIFLSKHFCDHWITSFTTGEENIASSQCPRPLSWWRQRRQQQHLFRVGSSRWRRGNFFHLPIVDSWFFTRSVEGVGRFSFA